mmetsp:Transcript_55292/g.152240  ORF Transcript_55292/g.152240 Transcript_55292/m.152240 type:complete len:216 (+) Transcript_55292:408-1055(+)
MTLKLQKMIMCRNYLKRAAVRPTACSDASTLFIPLTHHMPPYRRPCACLPPTLLLLRPRILLLLLHFPRCRRSRERPPVNSDQYNNKDLYPNDEGKIGLCKCYCDTCSTMEDCQPGGLTIASQCLIAIAAILVGIDAFYRVDQKIDKQLDAANELTCMGWEFASLSGDFEGHPSHQEAFESFVHETEIILGRLPSSELPYDFIEEPKEEPKTPKK